MPNSETLKNDVVYHVTQTGTLEAQIGVNNLMESILEGTFSDYALLKGTKEILDAADSCKRKEIELLIPKGANTVGIELDDYRINIYGWGQKTYNPWREEKKLHFIIITNDNYIECSMNVSSFSKHVIFNSSAWSTSTGNVIDLNYS
jgi:hypothetical protein